MLPDENRSGSGPKRAQRPGGFQTPSQPLGDSPASRRQLEDSRPVDGPEDVDPEAKAGEKQSDKPESENAAQPQSGGNSQGNDTGSAGTENSSTPPPEPTTGPPAQASSKSLKGIGRITGFARRHKKGGYIGGIVGAAIVASVVGFILILPFKALHFLQIIDDKAFAQIQQTVEVRTDKQLDRYIEKRLENPATGAWGHAKNGYGVVATGDISHDLYANWVGSNFEQDYTDKYGISFARNSNGHYDVLQNGTPVKGADGTALENIGNNAFRQEIKDATASETKWYNVLQRHQIRTALYERYGVQHWVFFAKTQQNVQDAKIAAKKAVYNALNNYIVTPVSSHAGQYFDCVINGGSACAQLPGETTDTTVVDATNSAPDTTNKDELANDQNASSQAAADATNAAESGASNEIGQAGQTAADSAIVSGATTEVIDETADNALADATAEATTGPIGLGLGFIKVIDKIGAALGSNGAVVKVITSKNSEQYADFFSTHATAIDQIKAGDAVTGPKSGVLAAFSGFTNQFKAFAADSSTSTANSGYTQVDAYNELLGDPTDSRVYKKYYAGDNISRIKDDNKCGSTPLPAGQVICASQKIVPDIAADVQSNPFLNIVVTIHKAYHAVGGGILNNVLSFGNDIVSGVLKFTGLQTIMNDLVSGLLSALHLQNVIGAGVNQLTKYFFGPILTGAESGGKWFDAMQAGADVTANSTAQSQLGGIPLTPTQVQAWNAKTQDEEIAKTQGIHGVWYKIASLDSANSLVGRLLAWSPSSLDQVPTKFAGLVGGLFSPQTMFGAGKYLGSVLIPGNHLAFADAPAYQSPFGNVTWGYPVNDPYLNMSADELDQRCQPGSASRAQIDSDYQADLANYNKNPYDPVNNPGGNMMTKTDPCMLEDTAINDMGALFDNSDDGGISGASTGTVPTTAPISSGVTSADTQQLAQQILTLGAQGKISFDGSYVQQDLQAASQGQVGSAGAPLSASLLQAIIAATNGHTIGISALESNGVGHCNGKSIALCPAEPHYNGDAVDINLVDGQHINGRDAASQSIITAMLTVLPNGSRFGQQECGPSPTLPSGITQFDDSCDHLHTDVPKGTP